MTNRYLLTLGIFICLLLPKFDLINIRGYAQGIRYDDIFLLLCLLYLVINNNIKVSSIPNNYLYFVTYIYLLTYGILSYYTTNIYALLLPLRWIEYSVFYVIICHINMSLMTIRKIIIGYIAINCIFVILQYNQIVGGIYSHGYIPDVVGRISGLTGGSWELPAILSMFVSASILDEYYRKKKLLLLLLIIVSALMVYLTGTRTGMIVYFVGVSFALFLSLRINIVSIIVISLIAYLFISQDRVISFVDSGELPLSMKIRLNAWDEYYNQMGNYDYIFGKGIGYSGLHVDGMFAKIFIDMGIVGLIIFSVYYIKFLYPYKVIGLITIIYCISIDFFTASKLMFAMYLCVFYLRKQKIHSKLRNCKL